jgi:hypothetical protein
MIARILKNFLRSWPFLLGLCSGIVFITLNITGKGFTHFPGDLGDARLNIYILEHAHRFLTGRTESLWNAPFMYPEPNVITYSENFVGTAPFYAIFRMAGFDRITSFQWWYLLITILNFTACYIFLKAVFKNRYAAVLGAFVFAFSMSLYSQMTHAQTFTRFPIPLAFWMLFLFTRELSPKYYFAALLFIVYQLYCGLYTGLLALIPFVFLFIFSLLFNKKILSRKMKGIRWLAIISGATLVNVLISLPLIIPYIQRSNLVEPNVYQNIFHTIPGVKSFFHSHPGSMVWDFLAKTAANYPDNWDHQIFVGGIAMICMLIFVAIVSAKIIRRNAFRFISLDGFLVTLFLTGFMTFFCYTRFRSFSFYAIVFKIPGFDALRSLTRIINVELIFFSVAVGFAFNLFIRKPKWISTIAFIILLGLLVADNYFREGCSYRTDKFTAQSRIEALTEKMKKIPAGSVVSYEPLEIKTYPFEYQLDAMLAAQKRDLKAVNGYTATSPYGYSDYWNEMTPEARMEWFRIKNFKPDTLFVIH